MDGRKMDVEPLNEQRWSRIERELFDRVAAGEAEPEVPVARPASAPRLRAATALILVGAAAAAIGGAAAWHALGSSPRSIAFGPSRIAAGASGSRVSVADSTIEVAPQSTAWVTADEAHGVTVLLEQGRVECEVAPRHGRPPFTVEAADVVVRVVGTHFAVSRSAAEIDVQVQRGVVEVTRGDRRIAVQAGETWPPGPPALPSAPSPAIAAAPVVPAAPPPSPAIGGPPAGSSVAAPTMREAYESATRLEASRPDQAVSIYADLAVRGGPWGMNALFAEGRLQADRGRRDEARRLLTDYLARYPYGPNAEDARQILERLR
jgi:hypothetical protein